MISALAAKGAASSGPASAPMPPESIGPGSLVTFNEERGDFRLARVVKVYADGSADLSVIRVAQKEQPQTRIPWSPVPKPLHYGPRRWR